MEEKKLNLLQKKIQEFSTFHISCIDQNIDEQMDWLKEMEKTISNQFHSNQNLPKIQKYVGLPPTHSSIMVPNLPTTCFFKGYHNQALPSNKFRENKKKKKSSRKKKFEKVLQYSSTKKRKSDEEGKEKTIPKKEKNSKSTKERKQEIPINKNFRNESKPKLNEEKNEENVSKFWDKLKSTQFNSISSKIKRNHLKRIIQNKKLSHSSSKWKILSKFRRYRTNPSKFKKNIFRSSPENEKQEKNDLIEKEKNRNENESESLKEDRYESPKCNNELIPNWSKTSKIRKRLLKMNPDSAERIFGKFEKTIDLNLFFNNKKNYNKKNSFRMKEK